MIVVIRTVPIFKPSIRATSQDRTSGLMPSGTRTLAPFPAIRELFQQDGKRQYRDPTGVCRAEARHEKTQVKVAIKPEDERKRDCASEKRRYPAFEMQGGLIFSEAAFDNSIPIYQLSFCG
ncbi:hypothetical protein T8A63_11600 [Sulfitobacter sp. OXR-159]|uniref:hypothetical protein n=1 Tax=Sulfitobacter sp. OXR-159 TaxID=3100174 RepID=UPI002AC9EC4E|nr:hypothetical protein [Sulfitobacter sp. OXR-159]WPZ31308.1 hypothetical protein T8A63_11600 [Sulfitobacter sp. OXR-159]